MDMLLKKAVRGNSVLEKNGSLKMVSVAIP